MDLSPIRAYLITALCLLGLFYPSLSTPTQRTCTCRGSPFYPTLRSSFFSYDSMTPDCYRGVLPFLCIKDGKTYRTDLATQPSLNNCRFYGRGYLCWNAPVRTPDGSKCPCTWGSGTSAHFQFFTLMLRECYQGTTPSPCKESSCTYCTATLTQTFQFPCNSFP